MGAEPPAKSNMDWWKFTASGACGALVAIVSFISQGWYEVKADARVRDMILKQHTDLLSKLQDNVETLLTRQATLEEKMKGLVQ